MSPDDPPDLVDPSIWALTIAYMKTLPKVEEDEETEADYVEPFV